MLRARTGWEMGGCSPPPSCVPGLGGCCQGPGFVLGPAGAARLLAGSKNQAGGEWLQPASQLQAGTICLGPLTLLGMALTGRECMWISRIGNVCFMDVHIYSEIS